MLASATSSWPCRIDEPKDRPALVPVRERDIATREEARATHAAIAPDVRTPARKRDRMPEQFARLGADPRHDDVVAMKRAANAVDGCHPQ
ncbi:hypothetical protein Q3A80_18400 [Burkholderia sp. SR8]|uniref:hypothetical protein n=1 Tax=Burkholderia sp. SR8 TaxID=3062277 RepID=UPI0040636647